MCVFTSDGRSVCSLPGRTTPAISEGGMALLVHAVVGLAFIPVPKRAREEGCVEAEHIVHVVNGIQIHNCVYITL